MFKSPEMEGGFHQFDAAGVESGVAMVGSKTHAAERMQVPVKFNTPFKTPPCVVANALESGQNDYPDAYTVTLSNVSTTGFEARVRRVDSQEQTWGQPLQLSWVAIGPR
jgi:hypothetical protein